MVSHKLDDRGQTQIADHIVNFHNLLGLKELVVLKWKLVIN